MKEILALLAVVALFAGCSKSAPSFDPIDKQLLSKAAVLPAIKDGFEGWKTPAMRLEGHDGVVSDIAFTPDGKHIVSAGYGDFTLRLWDAASCRLIDTQKTDNRIESICPAAGGCIVTADVYEVLTLWRIEDGRLSEEKNEKKVGHSPKVAAGPNGDLLAVASWDKSVMLLSVKESRHLSQIATPNSLSAVALSPSGNLLAAGGQGPEFYLWDLARGKGTAHTVSKVDDHSVITGLDFSADGKYLATTHNDSTISVWDVAGRKELHNFFMQGSSAMAVRFRPDGKMFATAQATGAVNCWDPANRSPMAILNGHKGVVRCLAWSPDGRTLASGGEDGMILLWR